MGSQHGFGAVCSLVRNKKNGLMFRGLHQIVLYFIAAGVGFSTAGRSKNKTKSHSDLLYGNREF